VQDQPEAECAAFGRRHEGIELVLNLDRVLEAGETQALAKPEDVGIDRKAGQAEGDAADHVSGLAPHTWHRDEIVQLARDLSPVALLECAGHPDQTASLGPEESGGVDDLFQLVRVGPSEGRRIGVRREQGGSDHVDAHVGALRRQDRRRQQLKGRVVMERAQVLGGAGVLRGQALPHHTCHPLGCPGTCHPVTVPVNVRGMNVQVLSELDDAQLSDLSALLLRCEEFDQHPALAEPQRVAAARQDLGAEGAHAVLAYETEALVGCALVTPAIDGAAALHVAVDPLHRADADLKPLLLRTGLAQARAEGLNQGTVRLWLMQATDRDDADAAELGFTPERDLLQMRVQLPLPQEILDGSRPVVTRPFVPGRDDEAWLTINNEAFAGHPEQGGWTLEDLHERTSAEWFDPEGLLMADHEDGTGLIGSCWNKLHFDTTPVMGEIYVISVDPKRHGEGWGRALTVAGLQWIAARGITVGMLYTTASNTAAVGLYTKLGFTIDHVDRSYVIS
jgi:mycothiol synthase